MGAATGSWGWRLATGPAPASGSPRGALRATVPPEPVNDDELGDLHLTDAQEDAIVAFLETLSDGYQP